MERRGVPMPCETSENHQQLSQQEGETGQCKCLGSWMGLRRRGRFFERSKRICRERDSFKLSLG